MKLRHAAASPFVRKVMVVAHEHGVLDRIELVPTTVSPVQANESLAPENPLMKVPSLTTDDGQVLFDSPVICEYLDSLSGAGKFFPASGAARWTARGRAAAHSCCSARCAATCPRRPVRSGSPACPAATPR